MTPSNSKICRWGLLGSAGIARKNWQAIFRSGNGRLVAVASRDIERSADYITENQQEYPFEPAPEPMGSYDDLLARDDIDAVYIPLPTGVRKEWVLKAAAAGKHVVCEKPIAPTAAEAEEMITACREAGVQFMDGVMFMHAERLNAMRAVLDDGESIGDLKRIAAQFSFMAPDEMRENNIRFDPTMEPLGCLGDLGWYCIRLGLWAMKFEMPTEIRGRIHAQTDGGVPTEFSGELFWENGVSQTFYCSFDTHLHQWAEIGGTKGSLSLTDYVAPEFGCETKFQVAQANSANTGCDFRMEPHRKTITTDEYASSHETAQETGLFRTFADLVLTGELDHSWGEMALKTQQVLETALADARA